jgi:hypothetical protein
VSRKSAEADSDQSASPAASKPGAIDAFKAMAKDLNG